MKKEKKRKYDSYPEIYMTDQDAFFKRNYPVDFQESSTNVIHESEEDYEDEDFEDTRFEHYL